MVGDDLGLLLVAAGGGEDPAGDAGQSGGFDQRHQLSPFSSSRAAMRSLCAG